MIPLGYMAKRIVPHVEWVTEPHIEAVLSVSMCMQKPFWDDFISAWRHNEHWFFDSPATIIELAREQNISLAGLRWFYYEAHEAAYNDEAGWWCKWEPNGHTSGGVVMAQTGGELRGFDVVAYDTGTQPGCSPLSCNNLAAEIPVSRFCLFDTLEAARAAVDAGRFLNSEPGPYHIIAVWEVPPPEVPSISTL